MLQIVHAGDNVFYLCHNSLFEGTPYAIHITKTPLRL